MDGGERPRAFRGSAGSSSSLMGARGNGGLGHTSLSWRSGMAHSPTEPGALREHYDMVFGQPWPVIPAALLVGTLNVFLFAFDRPWTASDGFRNWGDWLLQSVGI